MNCKPGDLAFIVNDDTPEMRDANIGALVKVLDADLCDYGEWRVICEHKRLLAESETTGNICLTDVGQEIWFMDANLRPIRDQPGDEEWFLKAPSPRQKEVA